MENVFLLMQLLLGMSFLTMIYHGGKLLWTVRFGLQHDHYFLGIGPKLFSFLFFGKRITVGIYFPVFGLSRIWDYETGIKARARSIWEFFEHPLYQRLVATVGGAFSLGITSVFIFIMLAYFENEIYLSKEEVNKWGIFPSEVAAEAGFQKGDKIAMINGKDFKSFDDLLYPSEGFCYLVIREGLEHELIITKRVAEKFNDTYEPIFSVYAPFTIKSCSPLSEAERIGLVPGDQITAVNGYPVRNLQEYKNAVKSDEDGVLDLTVYKENDFHEILYSGVKPDENGILGFSIEEPLQYTVTHNTFFEASIKGISASYDILSSNISGLIRMVGGKETQQKVKAQGPVRIASIYNNTIDWLRFWKITAMLGIFGAFTFLIPLPNTCFWNLIPLIYEATTKKRFPLHWHRNLTRIGYYFVILLMIWVLMGDVIQSI